MNDIAPTASSVSTIEDLSTLLLADGLPAQMELAGARREIRYRRVKLREANVADQRVACKLSERVMIVGGQPKLMVSEAEYDLALTMRHIVSLECLEAAGQRIDAAQMDLEMMGKLSVHDLGLLQERVYLMTLAAQVRYGIISAEDFARMTGAAQPSEAASPQPLAQAAAMGDRAAQPEPSITMLADRSGAAAAGAAAKLA